MSIEINYKSLSDYWKDQNLQAFAKNKQLVDEVKRLKEILAIKEAALQMASAAYRDAESDLAKAVEAVRQYRAEHDADIADNDFQCRCVICNIARALVEELGK